MGEAAANTSRAPAARNAAGKLACTDPIGRPAGGVASPEDHGRVEGELEAIEIAQGQQRLALASAERTSAGTSETCGSNTP